MRIIAISLVAAGSLGLMALGGRAIAADRMPRIRHSAKADSALSTPTSAPAASRLYYGGTLAPVVVQADVAAAKTAQKQACP